MSDVGISPRTEADAAAGLEDWPARINETARVVQRWASSQGTFGHESNDLIVRNAEKLLQNAIAAWEARGLTLKLEKVNAVVGAWVNGALAQVSAPPLKWTDPVKETVTEVKNSVEELAKPVGFGLGFGVVVVVALYLLTVLRPWK